MYSKSDDKQRRSAQLYYANSNHRPMKNREQSHLHSPPSEAMHSAVGRVGTAAAASRSHRSPHKKMRGPTVAPSKQTQTRWPFQIESSDSSNKLVHLNQGIPTKITRRRRSSSGLKALDSKLNNKGDARPQRKCRSNEFHTGGGGNAAACYQTIDSGGDSARDSDTNLLIENLRNRECELFTKINSNNYYCCSSSENDDLVYLMKKQNGVANANEPTDGAGGHSKRRRSPANRACRNDAKTIAMPQRLSIINQSMQSETRQSVFEYQTTSNESLRKVKFTITINRNSGIQTAGYQRVEFNSNPLPISNVVVDEDKQPLRAPSAEITDCSENCNSSSSVTEIECVDLSSSLNGSLLDRSGEYYDCYESSLNSRSATISGCSSSSGSGGGINCSSTSSIYEDAMESHADESPKPQRKQPIERTKLPMISIVQKLSANNEVSSTVNVDRKQIDSHMRNQLPRTLPTRNKPNRVTVIGDNFCNEVLNTLEQRNITVKNSRKRNSDSCLNNKIDRESYSSGSLRSDATSESVMSMRLQCAPKYTGTSIGRLLAARLEKNQMLGERRKELLRNLARENMAPPVKPPRSFTSMSSPSSKQSSEGIISATTLPIGELYGNDVTKTCGEFFQPTFNNIGKQQQHEANAQFGWIKGPKEADNGNNPPNGNTGNCASIGWTTANNPKAPHHGVSNFGWTGPAIASAPRISPNNNRALPEAYRIPSNILGMLNYEQCQPDHSIQTTHSKPQPQQVGFQVPQENIDTVDSSVYFDGFSSQSFPCSTPFATPVKPKISSPIIVAEAVENTVDEKVAPLSSSIPSQSEHKTDKKSNNAIARTKTLLGASKKFLKKPLKRKSPNKSPNTYPDISSSVEKSKHGSDEVAKLNSQDYSPNNHEKKSIKHLGFTPKKSNQVTIVESPDRNRSKSNEKLVRSSPLAKLNASNGSGKRDGGDLKKSANVMLKLNKFAKSPKKLLRTLSLRKPSTDPASNRNAQYEEHFYKSFNGSIGKVPIMREILTDLRHKVTGDDNQSQHSARRSLFRDEYSSSDVLDRVSDRIAEIDLHDEPEPLYAEVQSSNGPPAVEEDPEHRRSVETKEVFISSANESEPPRRYIMINNDPKVLYATVSNKVSASSSESLDMNVISNFADSVENMIERQLFPSSRPTRNEHPRNSASITEYYSGLEENDFSNLRQPIPLSDITSLDTFRTENLYESIVSERDMNEEIRNDIQDLEYLPATFDEISSDYEFGSRDSLLASGGAIIEELDEVEELAPNQKSNDCDTVDSAIPPAIEADVDYARGINTIPLPNPNKSMKRSPSYKEMKLKFHKSVKKGTQFLKQEGRKITELLENSLSKSDRKSVSSSPCKIRNRSNVCKYMDPRFVETLDFSNPSVRKLYEQLTQQLDIQNELREAIAYCRDTNEFENSTELVEAERLGLISMIKESAAENELDSICNGDDDSRVYYSSDAMTGSVTINSIRFTLKSDVLRDTQFNYFYVCICMHRGNVLCTTVRERRGNKVVFNDCKMVFNSLEPKFMINVEVHALCLRKSRPQNRAYESPMKDKNNAGNESLASESHFGTANDSLNTSSDISMFKVMGSTLLTSYDLCHHATPSESPSSPNKRLYSTKEMQSFDFCLIADRKHLMHAIDIDFRTEIMFTLPSLTGFLNIADCNSNWNRRWCSLDEFSLKFWNYPQDFNAMPPISIMLLSDCACENTIVVASREVCAKPRSFVIDISEAHDRANEERRIQRYFISTDTAAELTLWLNEINRVIRFLRDWHIG